MAVLDYEILVRYVNQYTALSLHLMNSNFATISVAFRYISTLNNNLPPIDSSKFQQNTIYNLHQYNHAVFKSVPTSTKVLLFT